MPTNPSHSDTRHAALSYAHSAADELQRQDGVVSNQHERGSFHLSLPRAGIAAIGMLFALPRGIAKPSTGNEEVSHLLPESPGSIP